MYLYSFHHYTPKVFGCLAFIVNPIFVYLVFTDTKAKFGNYRFLLLYFAVFNIFYSISDIVVPIGVHGYRYCFLIFISDGYFVEGSSLNRFVLICRCSMVSCSYAILVTHFLYRYLIIHRKSFINKHFIWYMLGSFALCAVYFVFWAVMCQIFLKDTDDIKEYIHDDFEKAYGGDSHNLNFLASIYQEALDSSVIRSWQGIAILSTFPLCTISFYCYMGYKIMSELKKSAVRMSKATSDLQKRLLAVLAIQTIIPICVSFTPCLVCWYAPAFNVDVGKVANQTVSIALCMFPFFDPVAIICCLSSLRDRFIVKCRRVETEHNRNNQPVNNTSSSNTASTSF